jgi:hypothetical protein
LLAYRFRIQKEIKKTSTFKHQKSELAEEGYDLEKCKDDPVYFYSVKDGKFEKVSEELVDDINNKKKQL